MQAGCREKRPSLPFRVGVLSACLLLPGAAFAAFAISMALTAHRTTDELSLQGIARALSAAVGAHIASYAAGMATLATSPLLDDPVDVEHFVVRARPLPFSLASSRHSSQPSPLSMAQASDCGSVDLWSPEWEVQSLFTTIRAARCSR